VEHDEALGDHYDPVRKRLVLSRDNFHGTSAAALGVAAHKCGLRAAAWTYVAAFITSLGYFLLHLLPLIVGRREMTIK
jgi:Zn-dependent membrane protease YugP